jgi:hypothetical protein
MNIAERISLLFISPILILIQYFAKISLQLMGWKADARTLSIMCTNPRFVAISLHTSKWDSIIGILFQLAYRIPSTYVIRHTWIKDPITGPILSELGFIAVDETKNGQTPAVIEKLSTFSNFVFIIMPEGDVDLTPRWKSGYYYIAKGLNVNILPITLDFSNHTLSVTDIVIVGDRSLEDVERECKARLITDSIPMHPASAFPAPWCLTKKHVNSPIVNTSIADWSSMTALTIIPAAIAYGFLFPVFALWMIYYYYGQPNYKRNL